MVTSLKVKVTDSDAFMPTITNNDRGNKFLALDPKSVL